MPSLIPVGKLFLVEDAARLVKLRLETPTVMGLHAVMQRILLCLVIEIQRIIMCILENVVQMEQLHIGQEQAQMLKQNVVQQADRLSLVDLMRMEIIQRVFVVKAEKKLM